MDFTSLLAHYKTTGNIIPLIEGAPKAPEWGHIPAPRLIHLLPTGQQLLDALRAAYEDGTPLPAQLEWADWSTVPRTAALFA